MKIAKKAVILSGLVALLAAPIVGSAAEGKRAYKIGSVLSYTGGGAFLGERMRLTAEMMAEEINKKGGINGHPINLILYDSASEVTKAVMAVNRLITQDQVDIIAGTGNMSGLTLAVKPIITRYKIPAISNCAATAIVEPIEESYWMFKSSCTDKEIIARSIDWWKSKGITRVAMISSTSGFGKSARNELRSQEPGSGIKVVAWEEFDNNANDLTPQLTRIRSADPQLVLCWTVAPPGVVFLKNAKQLGMKQILMHGFGYVVEKYMHMAGEAAEGCVLVGIRYPVGPQLPDTDPCKKVILAYMDQYKAKYGEYPDLYGSEQYDSMLMAFKAFELAKSFDKEKLRSALENLRFVGTNGVYNELSPRRHYGITKEDVVLYDWRNGRWNLLMAPAIK
jgi:branched-chain amino acid transport system substrate-binding protein